ncbi:zinc-binding alcohol dehydrogenase family protein [Lactobacillus sp. HT06-2]|uniref:zinc-binding alcohol dehydrogenase family protein n=1 Tax=Lactobacillus sp. HT06-2 TaxID=2080222 RepID=UPI0011AF4E52|nr:zinc-binding alcohol dehydrogenase family protein [Lactobacillus sp. HT06-2]
MMKAIIQSALNQVQLTDIQEPKFSPISLEIETKYAPFLRYDLLKLNGTVPAQLPQVMGYSATGIVTKAGSLRSKSLLHQKVLVLNPWGTFQEKSISNIPPLTIPITDGVALKEAAALVGGPDLALTLFKIITQKQKHVIIYGADSVTGLTLMQLLTWHSQIRFTPMVRSISENYLKSKITNYQIRITTALNANNNLVIDLVGPAINHQLANHLTRGDEILTVAQKDTPGLQFISRPAFPKDYQFLMNEIKARRLFIPINRVFAYSDIKNALSFQRNNPSRGRNLISFEK